jgi:hypothetical protein
MYSYEENDNIVKKAVRKCLNESFYNDDEESIERQNRAHFAKISQSATGRRQTQLTNDLQKAARSGRKVTVIYTNDNVARRGVIESVDESSNGMEFNLENNMGVIRIVPKLDVTIQEFGHNTFYFLETTSGFKQIVII